MTSLAKTAHRLRKSEARLRLPAHQRRRAASRVPVTLLHPLVDYLCKLTRARPLGTVHRANLYREAQGTWWEEARRSGAARAPIGRHGIWSLFVR
jgi:hypothetical protein